MSMRLGDLAAHVPGAELRGDPELAIGAVTYDSRRIGPGGLFVAIAGLVTDGNRFVDSAVKRGAVAVASQAEPRTDLDVAWLRVPAARKALAALAAALHGAPATRLALVGVTGTNGKTTVAHLVDAALRAAGHRVGLLGTVGHRIGERVEAAVRTTPEASDLQSLLAACVSEGCSHAVLEVSSISLVLNRVFGCEFRAGIFTNLTRDHLDFHGDMNHYFEAKRVLFDSLLQSDGHALLNADDDRAPELAAATRGSVTTYGLERAADVRGRDLAISLAGIELRADTPRGEIALRSPLLGRFNASNLLAALATGIALDLPTEAIVEGLASVSGVPGRMERVQAGQDFSVIVDYAHTDDALRNLLESVRALAPRRLITVFGCGGDRDRTKRPLMGAVASRLSDVVVVTSDNPRSEAPETILDEIERGMNGGRRAERHKLVDRREAIELALSLARPGDAVVIAGRGHETVQALRDRSVPFDDRLVAREVLARLTVRSANG